MNGTSTATQRAVRISVGPNILLGDLTIPDQAMGVVLFAHGSGSSRFSPRNQFVATQLQIHGIATLLMDLLTADEESEDQITGRLRFDINLLANRLIAATESTGKDND